MLQNKEMSFQSSINSTVIMLCASQGGSAWREYHQFIGPVPGGSQHSQVAILTFDNLGILSLMDTLCAIFYEHNFQIAYEWQRTMKGAPSRAWISNTELCWAKLGALASAQLVLSNIRQMSRRTRGRHTRVSYKQRISSTSSNWLLKCI